ncbi:DUF6445 family protein [Gilvimarinus sp. 1_MG-2023]|uniref:DUF6445 family protein n=1 Tax=Gilvimarinus sp. 1_MG-2023 TaxID=3062638 RepID=UPI0026E34AF9|nr:DUF6445 family protein [Gilvimarinus sp. 1_MG-2023]MDO6746132.1 DUF6445 family protein [Gilvimarinus sp. 1_MG-2023]
MGYSRHKNFEIKQVSLGKEGATLLVIDSCIDDPDSVRQEASRAQFSAAGMAYPGLRAVASEAYVEFLMQELADVLPLYFNVPTRTFRMMMCHYSLVTTPPDQLSLMQRIPHVDVVGEDGFAAVHYFFNKDLGGTAFYRHRSTGFENIDHARQPLYLRSLEAECTGETAPPAAYIGSESPLFEEIANPGAIYNRLLVYRGNSLHSGRIPTDFIPTSDPLLGRLTVNSFVAPVYS